MPRIFISYSRQDLAVIERLEQALVANGLSVWRDQESLYGGQNWPKAIGEAIAASDYFLLLWSKNAADSHFIEFEWTTAIALRKAIIPCSLDDTPFPPSLRSIHRINIRDLQETLPRLLAAFHTLLPEQAPKQHSSEVIDKLQTIAVTDDPEKVVSQAKAIFNQEGWNVRGNVYQASGDIFLTIQQIPEQRKNKSSVDPWVKIVGLIATVLAIAISFFSLSDKVREMVFHQSPTTVLKGVVRDMDGAPVSEAIVEVQELPGKPITTTSEGGFYFSKVPGKPGDRVRVYVTKPGYQKRNEYVTLPGPAPIILVK